MANQSNDSKDAPDPLAEFRGDNAEMRGVSRKVAGHIHPAAFRQISQSATSDQVGGDPRHYQACATGERGQESIELRPVTGIWQAPPYRYMMNRLLNSVSGTEMILVFSFLLVRIRGRNLDAVYQAIRAGTCEFLQEYHPDMFSPPADDAPVITHMDIIIRGEDEEMLAMDKTKR